MPCLSDVFSSDKGDTDATGDPFVPAPGQGDAEGGSIKPEGPRGDSTIAGGMSGVEGSDDFG